MSDDDLIDPDDVNGDLCTDPECPGWDDVNGDLYDDDDLIEPSQQRGHLDLAALVRWAACGGRQ